MKIKPTYLYALLAYCLLFMQSESFAQYSTKSLNWNTNAYDKLSYTSSKGTMPYRLLKPAGYSPSKKYPLTVMLHGKGEGLNTPCAKANGANCVLVWGGKMHLDYNSKYPGFVIFPQTNAGDWSAIPLEQVKGIMVKLAQQYSIDLDKIYIHGLSAGGTGTWNMGLNYPNVFAAISPSSAAGDGSRAIRVKYTPIWTAQGAFDKAPSPAASMNMMAALQRLGKKPIYTYNQTTKKQVWPSPATFEPIYTLAQTGHDAWPTLYNTPTWMAWMHTQTKKKIIPVGGLKVGTTLGIAPGALAYEWSNGAKTNEIKANAPGTYRVRYKRYAQIFTGAQVWSDWSDPIVIVKAKMEAEEDSMAIDSSITTDSITSEDSSSIEPASSDTVVSESTSTNEIGLYPNPIRDQFNVSFSEAQNDVSVAIYDKFGALVYYSEGGTTVPGENENTHILSFDISRLGLKQETYIIKVSTPNVKERYFRVLKE